MKAKETVQTSNTDSTQKISLRERVCYGFGDLASNLAFSALSAFIMYYWTDVAGIAVGTAGMIILISKFFDGVSDVCIGLLVDKTHSKHGKARPWILWMAAPFAIGLVLVFSVPDVGQTGKVIYAFLTYTLLVAGIYTAINIPYGTMTALITQDQYERGVLNIFRMMFASIGSLIVSSITLSLVKVFGNDSGAWRNTFALYGVVAFLLFMACFKGTKERVKPAAGTQQAQKISTKDSLKALVKNKYWFMLLLLQMVNYIMMGLTNNGIYFYQYNLNNRDLYSVSMVANMLPMLLAIVLLAAPLMKRLGKRNTALTGAIGMLTGCVVMILGYKTGSVTLMMAGIAVKGAGTGLVTSVLGGMIADTIEYGEYRTGIRSEGLTYSASSFGGKVGNGLGSALGGMILSLGGYVEQAVSQTAQAQTAISVMYLYLPLALMVGIIVILSMYKLDKEYPEVIKELERRKQASQQ